MAEDDTAAFSDASTEPSIRVVAQFVRDLSFESPNVENLINGPGENPNLNIEVNVNARGVKQNLYECTIEFKASAASDSGVIYDLEIVYGGMFHVENMPADALEPFLLVNCPAILFPFLRRLAADLTREGGFPPLFLDPIDFASLYVQRKEQMENGADSSTLIN
ncbi:MAG: protein-export chaperone SecB [Pseudomonadota bacterium]